ncbi:MAG TPA: universal stress protein [Gaiellaceae bacterium]|jgi:nucleotide-binding universal stress UspA family protein
MTNEPIVICYDGSPGADRAIEAAALLLGPRRSVVVDVASPITPTESVATISSVVPVAGFEQANLAEASRVAAHGAELARAAGFEAEARTTLGTPTWQGVVDVADEIGAAVIVIGSRGLNGLEESFKGSLSHAVAEHAGRPVLIVPPSHGE